MASVQHRHKMKRRIRDALALKNSFVSETLKSILFCHFPDVTWTCSFHSSISSKHDLTLSATEQKPKRSPLHPSSSFPVSLTAAARSRWLSASQHMSTGPQITPTSRPLPAEASGDHPAPMWTCGLCAALTQVFTGTPSNSELYKSRWYCQQW